MIRFYFDTCFYGQHSKYIIHILRILLTGQHMIGLSTFYHKALDLPHVTMTIVWDWMYMLHGIWHITWD